MVTVVASGITVRLGRRTVVSDVSVALAPGDLVGVLGPNGAGKSTLVRAMLGLLPHDGTVTLDGVARDTLPRPAVARTIAYLPQGQSLHWPLSVRRLVALGRLPHLGPLSRLSDGDATAIEEAMARAEVTGLADRIATDLSGGERARVLLARALAVGAPALFVDEPLASLDPAHQLHGMALLRAQADAGGAVLAVLHDLTLAARVCDRVLVLDAGRAVADGPPRTVLTPDLLARVYGITAQFGDADPPFIVPSGRVSRQGL